jgi:hypothetical protein
MNMSNDAQSESIHTGSSFDEFLEEEGIRDEVESAAIQRVVAWQSAEEFFKLRSAGATGEALRWALDNGPDRPPDPGDEL